MGLREQAQSMAPPEPPAPEPVAMTSSTVARATVDFLVDSSKNPSVRVAFAKSTYYMSQPEQVVDESGKPVMVDGKYVMTEPKRIEVPEPVEFEFDGSLFRLNQICEAHGLSEDEQNEIEKAIANCWAEIATKESRT